MTPLSERWIQISERILEQIRRLEDAEDKDRLEWVRSIRFLLSALQNSLLGWVQWANNQNVMTRFTQEDLEKMSKKLSSFTRAFIEYDLEATKLGVQRGLKSQKKVTQKKDDRDETFYV